MGLGDLLAPAIAQGKDGAMVTKSQAALTAQNLSDPHSVDRYLAAPFLDREVLAIDGRKAAPWQPAVGAGGTVWIGAADASGLVVSYLQSLYWEFGSAVVLPRTGVLMQNRGSSFSLDAGASNALEPGRLPFPRLHAAPAGLAGG